MTQYLQATVGEIVKKDFRKADIFKKYHIDFCCGGGISLKEACERKRVDFKAVEEELFEIDNKQKHDGIDFDSWDVEQLIDYIIDKHHRYIEENTSLLYAYVQKVAKVHGDRKEGVVEIFNIFHELSNELLLHIKKEEAILFPFIKEMAQADKAGKTIQQSMFGSVENPISMMHYEHENAGALMEKIREIANNFTPPADACMTHRVSFFKLEEYETDLHTHIHLENNILFPKAMKLEAKVVTKN